MGTIAQNKWLVILGAVVIAGGVWWGLMGGTQSDDTLTTAGLSSPTQDAVVQTLLALRAVKLDGTIFSDPAFLSLEDFSTQIVPEPVGRDNPFAPTSRGATSTGTAKPAAPAKPQR